MRGAEEFLKERHIVTKNVEIYKMAFTHSSFNSDANTHHHDYERLEFMGDSVLGFVVASLIYKHHPEMSEGDMTRTKATLVQSQTLANKARLEGYPNFIRAGHSLSIEEVRNNHNILEDIFESVIGALYIDQGIDFVTEYITKIFEEDIINFNISEYRDFKSILQEAMQAEHRRSVEYKLLLEKGPPHERIFTVNVYFNDMILGTGEGKTKKEAEQNAAKDALSKMAK